MKTYTYFNPVKILFGHKSLEKLVELVGEYSQNQNILLVSGKSSLRKSGHLERIISFIQGAVLSPLVL